jgi:hypothetical protein
MLRDYFRSHLAFGLLALMSKEVYYDVPEVFQIYDCVGKDTGVGNTGDIGAIANELAG